MVIYIYAYIYILYKHKNHKKTYTYTYIVYIYLHTYQKKHVKSSIIVYILYIFLPNLVWHAVSFHPTDSLKSIIIKDLEKLEKAEKKPPMEWSEVVPSACSVKDERNCTVQDVQNNIYINTILYIN